MVESTPATSVKERFPPALVGFTIAIAAWPVPVGAVLFAATRFIDGWAALGLLITASFGWPAIGVIAGLVAATGTGRVVRGALGTVGVAVGIDLVLALSVI